MTAVYPVAVRNFVPHADDVEIIDASHVNALQDEVAAIESTLGVNPQTYAPSGAKATKYRSVGARLDSHEAALATQLGEINTLLAASKVGWATPALTVSGSVNPAVRLMPVSGYVDPGPNPVSWSSESVNVGGMYVAGSNVVAIPLGGLWSITVTMWADIDWTTLGAVQAVYSNLKILPVPIAYQRLAASIWIQGVQEAYGPDTVHWLPVGAQPHVIQGGNPPVQSQMRAACSFLGALTSGTQVQVKAEQLNGAISGAVVTAAFKYERAIAGVD